MVIIDSPPPAATNETAAEAPERALPRPQPGGMYFRLHNYRPCQSFPDELSGSQCATPTHALISGVYDDIDAVRRVWRAVGALRLAPGYPLLTHSDDLGMADERVGLVVVLGLFVDPDDARAWKGQVDRKVPSETVPLLDNDAAFARLPDSLDRPYATRVRPGVEVSAFRGSKSDEEPYEVPPGGEPREVACTLPGGSPIIADRQRLSGHYYEWMPVTCPDGGAAWVEWRATLAHGTVFRVGSPPHEELFQLVGAECDAPRWQRMPWSEERVGDPLLVDSFGGGC
jgi:hypothetical protein